MPYILGTPMKLSDLIILEAPYDLGGNANKKFSDSWMSYSATKRLYNELCSMTINGQLVTIYRNKENLNIINGYVDSRKKINNESANKWVFSLNLKEENTLVKIPKELQNEKILQTNYVEASDFVEGSGLAPFVYMALVQDGFTVVSDTAQFNGGIGLWKKLAREAGYVDMKVNILDDEYGFTKDADGKLIDYNGTNIENHQIWTSGDDYTGEHTLLVLTLK